MKNVFTLLFFSILFAISFSNAQGVIFTSEIHYDDGATDSADDDEMIEVYIENPQPTTLTDYSVVLYNGSSSQLKGYDTKTLDVFTATNTPDGTYYFYNYTVNGGSIQNGAPDGWAIVGPGDVVIEFLSYEGTFTAAEGPAAGMTSTDIGASESGSTVEGTSIQNDGLGNWTAGVTASPGVENAGNLPVELISFSVIREQDKALLSWKTATENNNSHFEIQYSEDGLNFKTIGRVLGEGYTSEISEYTFFHSDLAEGMHYYSLKQVDFDNKFEIFGVKSIEVRNREIASLYPTTVQNEINIRGAKEGALIAIYNMNGQVVKQVTNDNLAIDVSNIQAGNYVVRINDQVLQFVKL